MAITLKIETKHLVEKNKKINKLLNRDWTKILSKYKDLILKRASKVHKYKNRTGALSDSNTGKVTVKSKRLTVKNNKFYAIYVEGNTNNKWLNNAVNYYKRDMKRDLQDITKKY